MAATTTLILTSGGVRSFTAAATAMSANPRPNVILLHLLDGKPNVRIRSQYIHRQAKHLGIHKVVEAPLRCPKVNHGGRPDDAPPTPILPQTQTLVTGLTRAIELGTDLLLWPAQSNGDFDTAARITEQTVLVRHLALLENRSPPHIDTPLLELLDRQLIELGGQLDLPWELARSCLTPAEKPCLTCTGCRRRQEAFEAAGLLDPVAGPIAVH